MLSEIQVSGFLVVTQTFIEISKVEEEADKFKALLSNAKDPLEEIILCSRESPAFSTLVSGKVDEKNINGNKLRITTETENRLSLTDPDGQAVRPFPGQYATGKREGGGPPAAGNDRPAFQPAFHGLVRGDAPDPGGGERVGS